MSVSSLAILRPPQPDNHHGLLHHDILLSPDSRYPHVLGTIQELHHSLSEYDYVTDLINHAHALDKLQSPYPSQHGFPFPYRLPLPGARVRQLVAPMALTKVANMPIDSAPASPPELSNSKSSRASSVVSSNLSDVAGPADISHFEDIGLDDTHNGTSLQHGAMSNEMLYPGISSLSSGAQRRLLDKRPSMTSLSARNGSYRDLTNSSKRPAYPNLQGQVNGAMHSVPSLGPPSNRMRRGFTTSTTSLPLHHNRSRSPSPAAQGIPYRSSSRGSSNSRRSSNSTVGASPSLSISRKTSWQSVRRKSTQELEAEYDDKEENDDNDIPDDAYVINIPISPRMPHERPSPNPSRNSSPARAGMSPYMNQRASAPASFPDQRTYKHTSIGDKPPMESLDEIPGPQRTVSYSSVLSLLDEDARIMTEALEDHATEKETIREQEVQQGNARPLSLEKRSSSKIELPPVQKPSIMMDPLPMSKEKEAALSRTRPSHLPPKSKEEEEKHLREYKKMMAAAQESEKKRMSRLKADLDNKDLEERSKIDVWKHLIIPNWKEYKDDRRTRELWWKGVPPSVRGRVWTTGIGNELKLTSDSYRRALQKATDQLRLSKDESEEPVIKKLNALVEDTYPGEKLFQAGMPCNQPLREVLLAYSMYRPDVALFSGMSNLAALLTLNLDASDAFIALANVLNRPLPMYILLRDTSRLNTAYENVLKLMAIKLPALYSHLFEKLRLHPDEFLGTMFEGLMIGRMSLDAACRLWDAIVFEGDRVFTRAAVGTLSSVETRLYGTKEEVLAVLGRRAEPEILVKDSPGDFAFCVRAAAKVK